MIIAVNRCVGARHIDDTRERVDIPERRYVFDDGHAVGNDRTGHQGKRGVFRSADSQTAFEKIAASYYQLIQWKWD